MATLPAAASADAEPIPGISGPSQTPFLLILQVFRARPLCSSPSFPHSVLRSGALAVSLVLAEQEGENLSGLSTNPDKAIFAVRENGTTCLMVELAVKFLVPYDVLALNGIDVRKPPRHACGHEKQFGLLHQNQKEFRGFFASFFFNGFWVGAFLTWNWIKVESSLSDKLGGNIFRSEFDAPT